MILLVAIMRRGEFSSKSCVSPRYPILFSMKVWALISLRHSICPKSVSCPIMLMKRSLVTLRSLRFSSFLLNDSLMSDISFWVSALYSAIVLQFLIFVMKSLSRII